MSETEPNKSIAQGSEINENEISEYVYLENDSINIEPEKPMPIELVNHEIKHGEYSPENPIAAIAGNQPHIDVTSEQQYLTTPIYQNGEDLEEQEELDFNFAPLDASGQLNLLMSYHKIIEARIQHITSSYNVKRADEATRKEIITTFKKINNLLSLRVKRIQAESTRKDRKSNKEPNAS